MAKGKAKDGHFLSLPLAVRGTAISTGLPRHPGYSLFEWKTLCENSTDMPINKGPPLQVSLDALSKHTTEDDCWTAIRGKVYNVSRFLKYHPGRKAQLMRGAGIDSTDLYNKVHSWVNEETILKYCFVGYLIPGEGPKFNKLYLTDMEAITHNTKLFILKTPQGTFLRVPAGQYVKIRALIEGESVEREYTPLLRFGDSISGCSNTLMLMIKIYPYGKMTQHLSTIKIGDSLLISGPFGTFSATSVCSAKMLILIAAGSGLTPMISLMNIRYMEKREQCFTLLLFANKTEDDILWREQLEEICHLSPQFRVVHVLSSPSKDWQGETGKISYSFLQRSIPRSTEFSDLKVCISGPLLFARTVYDSLVKLEYPDDSIHSFD